MCKRPPFLPLWTQFSYQTGLHPFGWKDTQQVGVFRHWSVAQHSGHASQSAVWDLLDVSRRERSLTAGAGRGLGAQGHCDDSRGCQLPTCSVTRHPSHLCGGFPGAPTIILAAKGVTGDLGSFLLVWEILEGLEVSAKEVGEGLAFSVVAEVSVMC